MLGTEQLPCAWSRRCWTISCMQVRCAIVRNRRNAAPQYAVMRRHAPDLRVCARHGARSIHRRRRLHPGRADPRAAAGAAVRAGIVRPRTWSASRKRTRGRWRNGMAYVLTAAQARSVFLCALLGGNARIMRRIFTDLPSGERCLPCASMIAWLLPEQRSDASTGKTFTWPCALRWRTAWLRCGGV